MTPQERRVLQQELAAMRGILTKEQADRRNTLMLALGYDVPAFLLFQSLTESDLFLVKEAIFDFVGRNVSLYNDSQQRICDLARAIEKELHDEKQ